MAKVANSGAVRLRVGWIL